MASYLVPMCNIYKFNLFNPDIALFAVQKVGLNGGRFCQVYLYAEQKNNLI